jgi:CDP-4-dehydro-6-deoxyglucose reductase
MTNKITLANGKSFNAEISQTILEAASLNGLALEHSCRTGRCGVCKTLVTCGETETNKPEESLSEYEASEGFILTCCRKALTDLKLDAEDLGELGDIQVKTLPCRIDNLRRLSADVVEVALRLPPNSPLEYLPGQYVDMIGKDGLRRSYSVANAPREDGKISLQIRKVENGQMSQYWFNEAKVNDLLRMEGPLGTFCLRENPASNLILLATGTGIAPIKAILEHLSESPHHNTYHQIHLYWGGRTAQDLYWQPDFPGLPLSFTPVLSRVVGGKTRTGYVQHAVIDGGPNLKDAVVYACGSEMMIHSAHEQLVAAGLNTKHFYSDAFVSSN